VSCDGCRDIEERDGEPPRCKTADGCLVPALDDVGQRLLRIWSVCNGLRPLGGAPAVLAGLGLWELDVIAAIESEVTKDA
jgi:hypothetical protein